MHINTDGASKRLAHRQPTSRAAGHRPPRHMPAPALLSRLELQRLVAAMVD